jgi:hypothetical protein
VNILFFREKPCILRIGVSPLFRRDHGDGSPWLSGDLFYSLENYKSLCALRAGRKKSTAEYAETAEVVPGKLLCRFAFPARMEKRAAFPPASQA